MDILDTDTLISFPTNVDDPLCHDHKHISKNWILAYIQFIIFSFQECNIFCYCFKFFFISSCVYHLSLPLVSFPDFSEVINFLIFFQLSTMSFISQACLILEVTSFLYPFDIFLSTRYLITRFVTSWCGTFKKEIKSIL